MKFWWHAASDNRIPTGITQAVPIFVISLAAAPLRRERISNHLVSLGLSYHVVDAVDGRQLTPGELADVDGTAGASPVGQIGCYLSHFKVYRHIVDRGLPLALILEDDARLNRKIVPLLHSGLRSVDFDYLFLDCATHSDTGPVYYDRSKPVDLGFGLTAFPLSGGPQATHALMITFDAARKRLKHALPVRQNIDIYSHLPEAFRFAAMVGPKGAHLAEDSLVSFTSARDMRAARPKFTKLRRLPLLVTLRDRLSLRYWRSARLAREWVKSGKLSATGCWRPLPAGRRIFEVSSAPLDQTS